MNFTLENNIIIDDPYEEIFLALEKNADILNHLIIKFLFEEAYEPKFLKRVLPKFYKLKTLIIDDLTCFTQEQMKTLVYPDLEILNVN